MPYADPVRQREAMRRIQREHQRLKRAEVKLIYEHLTNLMGLIQQWKRGELSNEEYQGKLDEYINGLPENDVLRRMRSENRDYTILKKAAVQPQGIPFEGKWDLEKAGKKAPELKVKQ